MERSIDMRKYSMLKDWKMEFHVEEEYDSFSICFWLYMLDSPLEESESDYTTIIKQRDSNMLVSAPFLALDKNKNIMLYPLSLLHEEAPNPVYPSDWTDECVSTPAATFPFQKWVHIACEISRNSICLHVGGQSVGRHVLTPKVWTPRVFNVDRQRYILLYGDDRDGFLHSPKLGIDVKSHYESDPPLFLSVVKPPTCGIEIDEDENIWQVFGGRHASNRKTFYLEVVLSNAIGKPVDKNAEVVAHLLYNESKTEVESDLEEDAPLLVRFEGSEFPAQYKPHPLVKGRAKFEMKISELSGVHGMFVIRFDIRGLREYPFFSAYSNQINSKSRDSDTTATTAPEPEKEQEVARRKSVRKKFPNRKFLD